MTIVNRKYGIAFWLIVACIFILTIGQFVPVYFSNTDIKLKYYFCILILLIIGVCSYAFQRIYTPSKKNIVYSTGCSLIAAIVILIIGGFYCFIICLTLWTEVGTFYVKKGNPKIKIIRRYLNEGAWGGGTKPSDYQIVVKRPFFSILNFETSIDTNKMDKKEWIRSLDSPTLN